MLKDILQKNYKWIIILLCSIILLAILQNIYRAEQIEWDINIYKNITMNLRTDLLTGFFKVITVFGGAYVLIAIGILSLIILKNKKIGLCINVNLIIIAVLNAILKLFVQRPRPEGYRLIDETGYSFPSGHSMVSMAFYGLIIYIIWKKVKNKNLKYASCSILGVLIILIGFSRIYLGVHYASDVIGGFAISLIYLILITNIIRSYLKLEKSKKIQISGKRSMVNKNNIKFQRKKKRFINSFKYAGEGIKEAFQTEQNLKIHFIIMIIVIIAGFIYKISVTEWIACIILFGLVISLELINTAIETTVDIAMPEKNPKAKRAKDVAAGAVLVSAIMAAVVGLIIFLPKI